jgi:predicted metal-dependent phosphoesterase TrpH
VPNGLLLCELHAHTTWSDGVLTVRELVDLHGAAGFDVLCVTDHVYRLDDPAPRGVDGWSWPAYLEEIEREAERARDAFDLLVIPGVELTDNARHPDDSAHALALGLRRFVSVDRGIVHAILGARAEGAAIVGAHPYSQSDWTPLRSTRRLHRELDLFRDIVDRWELANRREIFSWVAEEGLPLVATGDVHRHEHLASWKTLLPCAKREDAVVAYLRSPAFAYVMPFAPEPAVPETVAA